MNIYVKINDTTFPASITGRLHDRDWNDRESKSIRITSTYTEASNLFMDDVEWSIIQEVEEMVEQEDENGEITLVPKIVTEEYDNSEYSVAGEIIDHRDGTITVKMGKPTASELLAMIEEVL